MRFNADEANMRGARTLSKSARALRGIFCDAGFVVSEIAHGFSTERLETTAAFNRFFGDNLELETTKQETDGAGDHQTGERSS